MGGGGGQNTVSQVSYPKWVEAAGFTNYNDAVAVSQRPYQQAGVDRVAGLAPDSIGAANRVRAAQGTGAAQIARASALTEDGGLYNPERINLGEAPGQVGMSFFAPQVDGSYDPQQISAAAGPSQVNAGNIHSGMSAYQTPYEDQVVQSGLAAMEQSRLQSLNQTADQARAAGAFGGSRHGVMEGVVNSQAAMQQAQFAANTRSQGFQQAAALAESDRNAALTASGQNASNSLTYGQQQLAAQQANQSAGLAAAQMRLAGQTTNAANSLQTQQLALQGQTTNAANRLAYNQQSLAAQQANQSAGLQAANLRLAAGAQIGQLAGTQGQLTATEIGMWDAAGQQARGVQQGQLDTNYANWLDAYNYPLQMQNVRSAALGLAPYGQTQSSTTSGGGGSTAGMVVGGLTAGAGIASAIASDPDLKKNVEKVGEEDGLGVYTWDYKGEKGNKRLGLMADEVAREYPEAAINAGGVRGINPAALPPRLAALAQGMAPRPDSSKPVSRSTLSQRFAEETKAKKGAR